VLQTVWETRTAEMAQNVVVGLYPSLLVSASVVERTDAYLAGGDVPPTLRRLLLEGRDSVVRALRARSGTPPQADDADRPAGRTRLARPGPARD
jgi:aminopeptidase N